MSRSFRLPLAFKTHLAEGFPALAKLDALKEVQGTKEQLLKHHAEAFTIRRLEVTCDQEYKKRLIRGFLHLYDGQEAIAVGAETALTREDDWITTYRCHGVALVRGHTPKAVFAELLGKAEGASRGKGGSMHLYRGPEAHFWGGAAIVGSHVPAGAGFALAIKYKSEDPKKMKTCALAAYGDGAANQGQVWEAANMAMLWRLPFIMMIENNQYGMGTSVQRSSALTSYYKQGGVIIPGVQVNGMDSLAMHHAVRACKEHVTAGNGPVFLEAVTYRLHGHSMSDPGLSYRTREEVEKVRAERDPVELIKQRVVEAGFATADELKERERKIRDDVNQALADAHAAKLPPASEAYTDVYTTGRAVEPGDGHKRWESEFPGFVRGVERLRGRKGDAVVG